MAFNDIERKKLQKALDAFVERRRPPMPKRSQLDFSYNLSGHHVELVEIRPQWDDASVICRRPYARATYVRTQNIWKIFWQRASLKWNGYDPVPTASSIEGFLKAVEADPYGCFYG